MTNLPKNPTTNPKGEYQIADGLYLWVQPIQVETDEYISIIFNSIRSRVKKLSGAELFINSEKSIHNLSAKIIQKIPLLLQEERKPQTQTQQYNG